MSEPAKARNPYTIAEKIAEAMRRIQQANEELQTSSCQCIHGKTLFAQRDAWALLESAHADVIKQLRPVLVRRQAV